MYCNGRWVFAVASVAFGAVPLVKIPLYGGVHTTAYYFADTYWGDPPQRQSLIVDTGSSVVAFPCDDCQKSCGTHMDPPFQRSASTSTTSLPCSSSCRICTWEKTGVKEVLGLAQRRGRTRGGGVVPGFVLSWKIDEEGRTIFISPQHLGMLNAFINASRGFVKNRDVLAEAQCAYQIHYVEGSSLSGEWYSEQLHLTWDSKEGWSNIEDGSTSSLLVEFGCNSLETNLFVDQVASGILGLEAWPFYTRRSFPVVVLSVVTQAQFHAEQREAQQSASSVSEFPRAAFSICLASSGGVLTFGGANTDHHVTPFTFQGNEKLESIMGELNSNVSEFVWRISDVIKANQNAKHVSDSSFADVIHQAVLEAVEKAVDGVLAKRNSPRILQDSTNSENFSTVFDHAIQSIAKIARRIWCGVMEWFKSRPAIDYSICFSSTTPRPATPSPPTPGPPTPGPALTTQNSVGSTSELTTKPTSQKTLSQWIGSWFGGVLGHDGRRLHAANAPESFGKPYSMAWQDFKEWWNGDSPWIDHRRRLATVVDCWEYFEKIAPESLASSKRRKMSALVLRLLGSEDDGGWMTDMTQRISNITSNLWNKVADYISNDSDATTGPIEEIYTDEASLVLSNEIVEMIHGTVVGSATLGLDVWQRLKDILTVSRQLQSTSTLNVGNSVAMWTPIVQAPNLPPSYTVGLTRVSAVVGGHRQSFKSLPQVPQIWNSAPSLLDSGTTISYFPRKLYVDMWIAVEDAVASSNLRALHSSFGESYIMKADWKSTIERMDQSRRRLDPQEPPNELFEHLEALKGAIERTNNIMGVSLPRPELSAPKRRGRVVKADADESDEECWVFSAASEKRKFPTFEFQFLGGVTVSWGPDSYLYSRGANYYCLAFASESSSSDSGSALVLGTSFFINKDIVFSLDAAFNKNLYNAFKNNPELDDSDYSFGRTPEIFVGMTDAVCPQTALPPRAISREG